MFDQNMLMGMLGGIQNFNQRLGSFRQNLQQQFGPNVDPTQIGQQLINSGQMSQQQFEQFRQIANQLTGKNY